MRARTHSSSSRLPDQGYLNHSLRGRSRRAGHDHQREADDRRDDADSDGVAGGAIAGIGPRTVAARKCDVQPHTMRSVPRTAYHAQRTAHSVRRTAAAARLPPACDAWPRTKGTAPRPLSILGIAVHAGLDDRDDRREEDDRERRQVAAVALRKRCRLVCDLPELRDARVAAAARLMAMQTRAAVRACRRTQVRFCLSGCVRSHYAALKANAKAAQSAK